jgi:arylsulfatase A-like enzyme
MFLVGFPQIYGLAWLMMGLGLATRLVPALERRAATSRRVVFFTFPVLAGLVAIMAGYLRAGDWLKERRERMGRMPPPGSTNVLLIVMDTVAADHLSLYGYDRPTSPTMLELSGRGFRFDAVQAPSSWTLPSHASMFTGRWPHELSAGWHTPLDGTYPTLSEYLGTRGYATAGFVANMLYCASDSGLGRGFTQYRDHIFPGLSAFKTACLVNRPLEGIRSVVDFLDDQLDFASPRRLMTPLFESFKNDRKDAASVNRQFLHWLATRCQPERPFFAFLNYFDAHGPYQLAPRRIRRFGVKPSNARERSLIENWWFVDKKGLSNRERALAYNAYDDCIAALDEQLGRLFDELESRGVLETTWVIIASDHGESFGEHPGVFCHGTSLYQSELHVPLVIIPPARVPTPGVVTDTVSLRNLPATVVDLVGRESGSPFPGKSLMLYSSTSSPGIPQTSAPTEHALAEVVPHESLDLGPTRSYKPTWPLGSVAEGEWAYIRREGDVSEELFHLQVDAKELHNLAADPSQRARLELMRETLKELTDGPLTPDRFSP